MKRIIPLYILKEFLPPFFLSIVVFTFISLMTRVLELTELIVVRGVQAGTILHLLALSMPFFLTITVPMSTLLAVLLTFLRMSGDNEITVLKSAGVSLYQLLPPVVFFCLCTYLVTSYLSVFIQPQANQSFRNELLALAKARADVSVKERVFIDNFNNIVLYVNHIPLGSDVMQDIFIQDKREDEVASVIVARRGRIATDKEQRALIFQLFNGLIDRMNRSQDTTETITFQSYELRLNLGGKGGKGGILSRDQSEMPLDELWLATNTMREDGDRRYPEYSLELHRRLAIPLACLVLGLIAVPLGLQVKVKGRNWGIIMGLAVFIVYYLLVTAARTFGDSGFYPPALGMWVPNILIGGAAVSMIRRSQKEQPIVALALLSRLMGWFNVWQARSEV